MRVFRSTWVLWVGGCNGSQVILTPRSAFHLQHRVRVTSSLNFVGTLFQHKFSWDQVAKNSSNIFFRVWKDGTEPKMGSCTGLMGDLSGSWMSCIVMLQIWPWEQGSMGSGQNSRKDQNWLLFMSFMLFVVFVVHVVVGWLVGVFVCCCCCCCWPLMVDCCLLGVGYLLFVAGTHKSLATSPEGAAAATHPPSKWPSSASSHIKLGTLKFGSWIKPPPLTNQVGGKK